MVVPSRLRGLARQYFLDKELEELSPDTLNLPSDSYLVFRDANNMIAVRVLDVRELPVHKAREEIENAIVELVRVATGLVDKAYLAASVPRIAALPPPSRFRAAGVGLLLVTDDAVEEKVPPKPLRGGFRLQVPSDLAKRVEDIEAELAKLRRELSSLSRSLEDYRKELNKLSTAFESLKARVEELSSRPIAPLPPTEIQAPVVTVEEDLPDFVKDNPWLEQLSKRRG